MSYDLNFWRYQPDVKMNHQEVCELLSAGNEVDGLELLPIDQIRVRIADEFLHDWQQIDQDSWETESGAFQLYTTKQYFRVTCYGVAKNDMNRVVDALLEFECPLYDPQVGERFDSS